MIEHIIVYLPVLLISRSFYHCGVIRLEAALVDVTSLQGVIFQTERPTLLP